ncbi:MAG TPA: tetratricopeptide repeat protein [Candidatus Udaeobacter sp.]|jgi:tetratricopeptide (TPR) repeat protein|nr:tetratricopeptide repeat protein [Candidatus Udaeobacter sp.]
MIVKRAWAPLLVLALLPLVSCAYWNTFFLARKNYDRGTQGEPYLIEPGSSPYVQSFVDCIKYSKKLLSQYPKSKYVDDAYLLWARSLIGRQDPMEAVSMLNDYDTRFPKSAVKAEAEFYLGVAYRQGHKPTEALTALDDYLARNPKHKLVPYALLERSRALSSLDRRREAAEAATQLITNYPKSPLVRAARMARSEALLADGEYGPARDDFRALGLSAANDDERFDFLLREADCLEGARQFDEEIELLHRALAHEPVPIVTTTTTATGAQVVNAPTGPGVDHWGRLRLRVGTADMMAERLDPALEEYRQVLANYPRTPLAAEAQYRIGYAYEMLASDFDKARVEYGKVKDVNVAGNFSQQATQRLTNLDRLKQYGQASGRDSLQRKAEAGFLLAELYLYQHNRPEKALEQYEKLEQDLRGTPWAGKAINAQAWLLSRKMNRKSAADSLFWRVIHEYRATEAQLAARDYLEAEGFTVADSLIERPSVLVDTMRAEPVAPRLSQPPPNAPRLGARGFGAPDSLGGATPRRLMLGHQPGDTLRAGPPRSPFGSPDTLQRFYIPPDTLSHRPGRDSTGSPR